MVTGQGSNEKNKTKKGQKMATKCVQKQRIDRLTQTRFIDWRNMNEYVDFLF